MSERHQPIPRRAWPDDAAPERITAVDVTLERSGRRVLDGVNFTLEAGIAHALVGANGSGKSTLLHALAGLVPVRGTITPLARAALMTVHPGFHQERTLADHLRIVRRNPLTDGGKLAALVGDLFLSDLLARKPKAMSLGQQRAVGLLGPLSSRAPVLLLDEPFLALDARRLEVLQQLIVSAASERRIVVVSSHDLAPLSRCCSFVLALAHGRVQFAGEVVELNQERAAHVLVRTAKRSEFAEVVGQAWGAAVHREPDGRLRISGHSMAEVLQLSHSSGIALEGVWDAPQGLEGALVGPRAVETGVAA